MGWFVSFCYFSLSPKLKLLMINMCQAAQAAPEIISQRSPAATQGKIVLKILGKLSFPNDRLRSSHCLFPPNNSGFLKMTEHIAGPFSWAPFKWEQKAACQVYQYNCDSHGHCGVMLSGTFLGAIVTSKQDHLNGIVCSTILKWMALGSTSAERTGGFSV